MLHPRQTYVLYAEVKRCETPPSRKKKRNAARPRRLTPT